MPTPSNCYICHKTWLGKSPICDTCFGSLAAALAAQQKQQQSPTYRFYSSFNSNMARRNRSRNTFSNYHYAPRLPLCPACKGNYIIESKAGNVCSNCHEVVHNPCRNCDSSNTRGIKGDSNNQFIECMDCLMIE